MHNSWFQLQHYKHVMQFYSTSDRNTSSILQEIEILSSSQSTRRYANYAVSLYKLFEDTVHAETHAVSHYKN